MTARRVVPLLLILAACETADRSDPQSEVPAGTTADTVSNVILPSADSGTLTLHFTRDEQDTAVTRRVPADSATLESALRLLVQGPTAQERAGGVQSWFSAETAGHLRAVELHGDGTAVIDFRDLRQVIPNASSSAGSAMLLRELSRTAFEFPEVRALEVRMEGSCDLFWEWLQYGCQRVSAGDF